MYFSYSIPKSSHSVEFTNPAPAPAPALDRTNEPLLPLNPSPSPPLILMARDLLPPLSIPSLSPPPPSPPTPSSAPAPASANPEGQTGASSVRLKGFAAGTASGLTKLVVGHPFDVIKVRSSLLSLSLGLSGVRGGRGRELIDVMRCDGMGTDPIGQIAVLPAEDL